MLQVKKEEFSTYQKIFNFSYLDEEIIKYKENEKIILQKIVNLQLNIIKNMIEHYGNISQIYTNDIVKKEKLKKILIKNNIIEKENKNNIIDLVSLNKINTCVKKIIKNTFNNDVFYQFNIIKEVQEEKESEKISNNRSSSNIVTNSKNSLMNDAPDEILFIDKKESDNEEDLNISKKKRYSISNIKIENDLKNNYFYNKEKKSNSKSLDKIKKEEQKDKGKNMKKELIGINKKKFKGKNLNIEEIDIDFNANKKKKKDNFRKNEYFNNRKKG